MILKVYLSLNITKLVKHYYFSQNNHVTKKKVNYNITEVLKYLLNLSFYLTTVLKTFNMLNYLIKL